MSQNFKLKILFGLYVSALIGANLMGNKITTLKFGNFWESSFSVGLFIFPITFFIIDMVEEVKGKKETQEFIYAALICVSFLLLYSILVVNLPPAKRFSYNASYVQVFGNSIRVIIASLIAFLIGQLGDLWSFIKIKEQTRGKFLWLRNNLSTFIGQFVDTWLFYIIALYKIPFAIPFLGIESNSGYDFAFLWKIFWPYFLLKVLIAIFNTPLVYIGVKWLKKDEELN
jgi:queuosine precursor transporter